MYIDPQTVKLSVGNGIYTCMLLFCEDDAKIQTI